MNTKSFLRKTLLLGVTGISLYAYATTSRKVTIPAYASASSGSSIDLFNGSSVTVTYNLTCYDKNGTVKMQKNGATLAPMASTTHGVVKCSDGTIGNQIGDVLICGYTTQANAPSMCPSNYNLCSQSQATTGAGATTNNMTGWTSDVPSGYTYYSYDNVYWNPISGTPGYSLSASNLCANDNVGTGAVSHCGQIYTTAPAFCCPSNLAADRPVNSCVVEITSATSVEGFLQSPQYKGNSPF